MELLWGHSGGLFEHLAEIEGVLVAHYLGYLGDTEMLGQKQLLGPFDPQVIEELDGRNAGKLLKAVGEVIGAEMAVVGHILDAPRVHVAAVQPGDQLFYQGDPLPGGVQGQGMAVEQRQQLMEISSDHLLETGLAKLAFQNNLVKQLFQVLVLPYKPAADAVPLQQPVALGAQKMDPVDFRGLPGKILVDLGLQGTVKDDAPRRHDSPLTAQAVVAASLADIKDLVIRPAPGALDGKILGHKVLVAAAVDKQLPGGVLREDTASGASCVSRHADHAASPPFKTEISI